MHKKYSLQSKDYYVHYHTLLCITSGICDETDIEQCEYTCTVVDIKKKSDSRCYSDTYHRREMKLIPFFLEKCPL